MSDQLERLLSANKELQDNMEVLQTELGRKQTEFEKLLDERYFWRLREQLILRLGNFLLLRSWWPVNRFSSLVWGEERAGRKTRVLFPPGPSSRGQILPVVAS